MTTPAGLAVALVPFVLVVAVVDLEVKGTLGALVLVFKFAAVEGLLATFVTELSVFEVDFIFDIEVVVFAVVVVLAAAI